PINKNLFIVYPRFYNKIKDFNRIWTQPRRKVGAPTAGVGVDRIRQLADFPAQGGCASGA
ncbi:MAG: hypothetical protein AAB465_03270, partial [Patescibacteria group bacterium]